VLHTQSMPASVICCPFWCAGRTGADAGGVEGIRAGPQGCSGHQSARGRQASHQVPAPCSCPLPSTSRGRQASHQVPAPCSVSPLPPLHEQLCGVNCVHCPSPLPPLTLRPTPPSSLSVPSLPPRSVPPRELHVKVESVRALLMKEGEDIWQLRAQLQAGSSKPRGCSHRHRTCRRHTPARTLSLLAPPTVLPGKPGARKGRGRREVGRPGAVWRGCWRL